MEADQAKRLFISYSHDDERFVDDLKKVLKPLIRDDRIVLWYDRELVAGSNLDHVISDRVEDADVFVSILSSSFLGSDYCTGKELKRAIDRARAGNACLVGIVVRPCHWEQIFPSNLLVLPKDAKAITKWSNRDEAWTYVVKEIARLIDHLQSTPKPWTHMRPNA